MKRKEKKIETENIVCSHCKISMSICATEYRCELCGKIKQRQCDADVARFSSAPSISTSTRTYFASGSGTQKSQRKSISNSFAAAASNDTSVAPPPGDVLEKVIDLYLSIELPEEKTFVRRGSIKSEILAALIYYVSINCRIARKKADIAKFLGLPTSGFSRGEQIVLGLVAKGALQLEVHTEPASGFIDRYLDALDMSDQYIPFINAVIDTAEEKKILMNSQISSKIAGVIWVLVLAEGHNITWLEVEAATDGTKKNTFIKFSREIYKNRVIFEPIFVAHKIKFDGDTKKSSN